jgi:hypothetical protein
MAEFKVPTETVTLPSKGLLYSKESPLSKGEIEMKYMTAAHEDILTNANYIKNGTVIDKLLQALIVTNINYSDLLVGDKNVILIAARILGYGKDYTINHNGKEVIVDLTQLTEKIVDESLFKSGANEFTFNLPNSGNTVTFKILTHGDEQKIETEIKGLQKVNPNNSTDLTTTNEYLRICNMYGFIHIKKDNIGITGGRQFIAEHFNEQNDLSTYYFFEDDMAFYSKEGYICKNGFNRFVKNLFGETTNE